jgi:hypothetical protein
MKNIRVHPDPAEAPASPETEPTPPMAPQETASIDLEAFAWTYAQKSGELQQDGKPAATGYSGAGAGKNNPAMQNLHDVGPIPQGDWKIAGPPIDTPITDPTS